MQAGVGMQRRTPERDDGPTRTLTTPAASVASRVLPIPGSPRKTTPGLLRTPSRARLPALLQPAVLTITPDQEWRLAAAAFRSLTSTW